MSFKEDLVWLQGRRVLICEPDPKRLREMTAFLKRYQLEVEALREPGAMLSEIEKRRYATHRVYILAIVDQSIALQMEPLWRQVSYENPMILGTPLALSYSQKDEGVQSLLATGFFRYELVKPVTANRLLRLLSKLNRWKALRQEIEEPVQPSARLSR